MKKVFIIALISCFVYSNNSMYAQKEQSKQKKQITENKPTKMDTFSYSLGMLFAKSLIEQGIENVVVEDLTKGMTEMMNETSKFTLEQASSNYNSGVQQASLKKNASVKDEGENFLAMNKTKPGVITTASGLQYLVMTMGTGPKPTSTDKVKTHYHGTLINGKVFDSSVQRGEPISFPVNGVIAGWTEALQLMPVGSKFKLFIPYNLAYGERGAGADIKPFAALIFEVELLGIE
ncbi:MAG: FKBP-type peptidyl-prolyl cis-trans isomerase [Saprospiraceae bacterium]